MGLKHATGGEPAIEPIGLEEAKDQVKQDVSEDDALIDQLIVTSRMRVEKLTGRALLTQTFDWTLDLFSAVFAVPRAPLQSVASIKYIDTDGVEQTLSSAIYQVDTASEPGRIAEAYEQSWPAVRNQLNAVTIQFVAGYGDGVEHVPAPIKSAMLLIIGELHERREESVQGQIIQSIPLNALALLEPYILPKF